MDMTNVELFTIQRKRLNLTIEELAQRAKVALWKLNYFSCGMLKESYFSPTQKSQIAAILKIPVELLFEEVKK